MTIFYILLVVSALFVLPWIYYAWTIWKDLHREPEPWEQEYYTPDEERLRQYLENTKGKNDANESD